MVQREDEGEKKNCLSKTQTYLTHEKCISFNAAAYRRGMISRWWAASGQQSRICSGGSGPVARPVGGWWVGRRGLLDLPGARAGWEETTRAAGCRAWKDTRLYWRLERPACGGCCCEPAEGRKSVLGGKGWKGRPLSRLQPCIPIKPASFIHCLQGGRQGFNLHEIDEILICSNIIALAQVRAK